MLLVFLLLLPLVLVPFLVEWDNKWFKRFAYVISGVQMIVMLFQYYPEQHSGLVAISSHLSESVRLLIKAVVVHLF